MSTKQRVDTRGLPEGMDPHSFYEYRTLLRANQAVGIEAFLYRLMGRNLVRSFAIAIDPFAKFRVTSRPITPAKRKRTRFRTSVLDNRKVIWAGGTYTYASVVNYLNIPGYVGPVQLAAVYLPPDDVYVKESQVALPDVSIDTTRDDRLIGSEDGELDLFRASIYSSSRRIQRRKVSISMANVNFPPPSYQQSWYNKYTNSDIWIDGPSATFPRARYDTFRTSEKAHVLATMQKHALSMYKGINPSHRQYSLFRNVVELRDLPRTILSLRTTLGHLMELDRLLTSKDLKRRIWNLGNLVDDIPREYVGYHFGWKQTYNDIMGLLSTPAAITKRVNFLIRRSGKATTLRSTRNYTEAVDGVPGFDYSVFPVETNTVSKTRLQRDIELRMVLNARFDFPPVDMPRFRSAYFAEKIGLVPRPTDLYNLVPWTWLVDWFTGLGDYIEVIDEINRDQSLINYGFLTGVSRGRIITNYQSQVVSTNDFYGPGGYHSYSESRVKYNHSSVLDYVLHLRKDLSSIFDVATISSKGSLNPYQSSILLSLLSQRENFRRYRFG